MRLTLNKYLNNCYSPKPGRLKNIQTGGSNRRKHCLRSWEGPPSPFQESSQPVLGGEEVHSGGMSRIFQKLETRFEKTDEKRKDPDIPILSRPAIALNPTTHLSNDRTLYWDLQRMHGLSLQRFVPIWI